MSDINDATLRAALPCRSCGKSMMVIYQASKGFNPRWSAFDCPHCAKPNVARFPGNVISTDGNMPVRPS